MRRKSYQKRRTGSRNPHAVALGSKGGVKGGPARAAALTPEERTKIARQGGRARQRGSG